ncbi:MAG: GHKL domain-containing protein [Bifidobacteriaceae bacterium]|jgi:hypothetical protein|nr:GHKL domain-containing protein [Bifidobacteriaceae bacterium]
MITNALPDIPRLLTALAEWLACLIYVLVLPRRLNKTGTCLVLAAGAAGLWLIQSAAASWPIGLWVPGMVLAVTVMYAVILAAADLTAVAALYLVSRALILAELVASMHWQLHTYLFDKPTVSSVPSALLLVACCGGAYSLAWWVERRHFSQLVSFRFGWRESVLAVCVAMMTFMISNISFVTLNTPFSARTGMEVFYVRTLVDLAGWIGLYVQQERWMTQEIQLDKEAMRGLLRSQHAQYLLAQRNSEEMDRKYHDFKHHLTALRAEPDPGRRGQFLDQLEESVRGYANQVRSGSSVLDTLVGVKRMHAAESHIEISVVADGRLLAFIDDLDTAAIIGNALDNAIEGARRVADPEQRLIRFAVYSQDGFVMMRFENSFDGVLLRQRGRLATRKAEAHSHGYGLRSIEAIAQSYGGTATVEGSQGWFSLRVLIPMP